MEKSYADVIVDITSEKLDRTFQYRIPEQLKSSVRIGMPVLVPFGRGNRMTNAYVVGITENAQFQEDRMKEIAVVPEHPVGVETRLIALASWMKETYGSAMIQALKTVLPHEAGNQDEAEADDSTPADTGGSAGTFAGM